MTNGDRVPKFGKESAILGIVLIAMGILFLIGNTFDFRLGRYTWPFFIIVPGVVLFVFALTANDRVGKPLVVTGSIVTMVGLILFYQNIAGHFQSWSYAWTLVFPTSFGLSYFIYGSIKDQQDMVKTGKRFATIGFIVFLIGLVFFELVIGISGYGSRRYALPFLLIAAGVVLILYNFLFASKKS